MKLLHTADWHVGRAIRGRSRHDEHAAVLAEIVDAVATHEVDLVVVVGDLFETASPPPESEALVYRTLLDLARTGAQVAVVAGNHDNARRLHAVAPVFESAGRVHVVATPARPDDGGVLRFTAADGAEVVTAMLPFVSQRGIVRARDLMDATSWEHAQAYADRMRLLVDALTAGFSGDTVNLVLAHAFVLGGELGGGERGAHIIEDYALPAQLFPATASYVALGHVHRPQKIPGAAPIHYCGSPLALDFGESVRRTRQANLVTVEPGTPALVEPVPLTAGRELRTLRGTMAELAAAEGAAPGPGRAGAPGEAWLRVIVREPSRAGLADDVRALLGEGVVEVRVEDPTLVAPTRRATRRGRAPQELFTEYLTGRNVEDRRLLDRFAELLDAHLDGADASEALP